MKKITLNVCGHPVKLRFVDDIDGSTLGLFDPDKHTIDVVRGDHWESTFLHEFFHAFLHYSGWSYLFPGKLEEVVCTSFSHAFLPVFKNGLALRWKMEDDAA